MHPPRNPDVDPAGTQRTHHFARPNPGGAACAFRKPPDQTKHGIISQRCDLEVIAPSVRKHYQDGPMEFGKGRRHRIGIPRIAKMCVKERRECQALHEVPHPQCAGVRAQPLRTRLDVDRGVEIRCEEATLPLTSSVFSRARARCSSNTE